ncbi:hypothetical protein [Vibrio sp.]|uniref:hypothetical protein n=1 Tax=Vibrio sp. TaxID=678 RepID=UPI0031201F1D
MIEIFEIERLMRLLAEGNRTKSFRVILILMQIARYGTAKWVELNSLARDLNLKVIIKSELEELTKFRYIEVRHGMYGNPRRKCYQVRLLESVRLSQSEYSKEESRLFGNCLYQLYQYVPRGGVLVAQALFAVCNKQARTTSEVRAYLYAPGGIIIKSYADKLERANLAQVARIDEDDRTQGCILIPLPPVEKLFNEK